MKIMNINNQFQLDFSKKTIIMGILNVTPDSFQTVESLIDWMMPSSELKD